MRKCSFQAGELSHGLSQGGRGRRLAFPASPSCSLRTNPLSSSEPQAHAAGTGSSCSHGRGQGPPPRHSSRWWQDSLRLSQLLGEGPREVRL